MVVLALLVKRPGSSLVLRNVAEPGVHFQGPWLAPRSDGAPLALQSATEAICVPPAMVAAPGGIQ